MLQPEVGPGALGQSGAAGAEVLGRGAPVQGVGPGRAVDLESALTHFADPRVPGAEELPVAEEDALGLQEPAPPELADTLLGQGLGGHAVAVDQFGAQRGRGGVGLVTVGHHLIGAAIDGQETGPARGEAVVGLGHADADVAVLEASDIGAQGPPPAARVGRGPGPLKRDSQALLQPGLEGRVEAVGHAGVAVDHDVVQAGRVLNQGRRPVARQVHGLGCVRRRFLRLCLHRARHSQTGRARRQNPLHVSASPTGVGRRGGRARRGAPVKLWSWKADQTAEARASSTPLP
ncbi:hypothetical protein D3C80_1231150 [compost metagenome]